MEDADAQDAAEELSPEAQAALKTKKAMGELVTRLFSDSKPERAQAAKTVHEASVASPAALEPHVDAMVEALEHPEPQTRWELLGALEEVARSSPKLLDKAVVPATACLHDAGSSVVRVAAFRMLAQYGGSSKKRAEQVWPLLDEALRCYHGDSEYPGMLAGLVLLVDGRAPDEVKKEAAALVEPDASHPRAAISRRARQVFSVATSGKSPRKRTPGGQLKHEEPVQKAPAKKASAKKGSGGAKAGAKGSASGTAKPKGSSKKK
jgi:hypothetical protein